MIFSCHCAARLAARFALQATRCQLTVVHHVSFAGCGMRWFSMSTLGVCVWDYDSSLFGTVVAHDSSAGVPPARAVCAPVVSQSAVPLSCSGCSLSPSFVAHTHTSACVVFPQVSIRTGRVWRECASWLSPPSEPCSRSCSACGCVHSYGCVHAAVACVAPVQLRLARAVIALDVPLCSHRYACTVTLVPLRLCRYAVPLRCAVTV